MFVLAFACLSFSACNDAAPATEVMVLVDSEAALHADIASVELLLKSGAGREQDFATRLHRSVVPGSDKVSWPIELALVPGKTGVNASYLVVATAKDAQGGTLGAVSAISSYVQGHTLSLPLRFDAMCFARKTPCPDGRTCSAGSCVDSHVDASLLPIFRRDEQGRPVLLPFNDQAHDAGTADAGEPGGVDAQVLQVCGATQCDELAGCTKNQCNACPAGFSSKAETGCVPTLLGLQLSAGTVTPAVTPDVTSYAVAVPLLAQDVTFTPSVPNGVEAQLAGLPLTAAGTWTTPRLALGDLLVPLRVSYPAHAQRDYAFTLTRSGSQEAFIKARQTVGDDWFGATVAISKDTLVVGALWEDSGATGVDGNPDDDSVMDSGAAFVLERKNGVFQHTTYLKADTAESGAQFGNSVAIDGDTLVVGAQHAGGHGVVYVFTRSGSSWKKQAVLSVKDSGAESSFGRCVALQGDTLAIGAPGDDSAGLDSGAAYVFTRSSSVWTQRAQLTEPLPGASDWFGSGLALQGGRIVVGATGSSIGGASAGAAYVFEGSGASYTCTATLIAETPQALGFTGDSVAIDESTIVVGAWNRNDGHGEALVFEQKGTSWQRSVTLDAKSAGHDPLTDDNFGSRVAIAGDAILVGAGGEDSAGAGVMSVDVATAPSGNAVVDSGAAYLFMRKGGGWSALAHIKAAHPGTGESFGWAVALSSDSVVVGARDEKSDATLVNGDETRDGAPSSGAVYVFR